MRKPQNEKDFLAVACSIGAAPDKEIQLLPFGAIRSKKGAFVVDDDSIRQIIAAFDAAANDLVVDYEHQTLYGGVAPAAGWIKALASKGKDGLWGKVEWTPKAAEHIANKEYRYLSPVVILKNKKAVGLHSAALTNTPAIDGMAALANKDNGEEDGMDGFVRKLAVMLGLPETAAADDVAAAVEKACKPAEAVANKAVLELLGLKEDAKLEDVKAAVAGLRDPGGYVKAEEFRALTEKLALKERDDLVRAALAAGKVAPAQKDWADAYALKDPAGFEAFVKDAPAVVPLKELAGSLEGRPAKTPDELQLSINKALGIDDESYNKFGGEA